MNLVPRVVVRTSLGDSSKTVQYVLRAQHNCCFLFQPIIVLICAAVRVVAFDVVVSKTTNY